MNTTKSVYNRLFSEDKVELASERVDLTSIDDFNKAAAITVKGVNEGNALVSQAAKMLNDAASKYKQTISANESAIKLGEKIIADAKSLGIPAPDVLVKTVSMLQTRLKDLQGAADRISKTANGTYGITK